MTETRCINCGHETANTSAVDDPCAVCGGLVAFTTEAAWRNYERVEAEYDLQHNAWVAGGRVGSPPPRPIPPHVPGWQGGISQGEDGSWEDF